MENSCIKSPAKQPLVIIKAWQLYATNGDICAAALLSFFEYWHNYKLDKRDESRKLNKLAKDYGESANHDEDLFQFHTEEDLIMGIFGLYSGNSIRKSMKLLIDKNFISVHRNPNPKYKFDNTNFFLFHAKQVQKFIDNEYTNKPSNEDEEYYFDTEDFYEKFIKPKKRSKEETILDNDSVKEYDGQRKIEGSSRKIAGRERKIEGPSRKIAETITKITSETTTETTTENFMPSQSSGEVDALETFKNTKNNHDESSFEKPIDTLPTNFPISDKPIDTLEVNTELVISPKKEMSFAEILSGIRSRYQLYRGNRFLNYFAKHRQQLYNALEDRISKKIIMLDDVELAFSKMESENDFSIMDFLTILKNPKFDNYKILLMFIDIFLDGKVPNFAEQGKSAKKLCQYVEENKTTLTEIEDCFLWLPDSGRNYRLSLSAVVSALPEFDRVKKENNGRYVGGSLVATSREQKQESILKNRDYSAVAERVATRLAEQREARKRK